MTKVGFIKDYDKDFQLYLDLCKTLNRTLHLEKKSKNLNKIEYNSKRKSYQLELNKLAKRLKIKTIDKYWMI